MLLCDQLIFADAVRSRPLIEDVLNSCNVRWLWDYWVDWFGLKVTENETDIKIREMHEKAAAMRQRSKRR